MQELKRPPFAVPVESAALKTEINKGLADLAAGRVVIFDLNRVIALGKKRLADRSSSV